VTHRAVIRLLDAGALGEAHLQRFAAWLDDSERARLARFLRPERRRQFLAGRGLARRMLGSALGLAPEAVRLAERPGAAPSLALPGFEEAGFSISHSGRWVACAASASCRVGLDIETVDPGRDIDALAAQAFDAREQAWLRARPAHTRVNDFYGAWSLLEARFKLGLEPASSFDLSRPDLSIVLCCAQELAAPPAVEFDTPAG
jgi:4'-phosphopantetheinyl transferase